MSARPCATLIWIKPAPDSALVHSPGETPLLEMSGKRDDHGRCGHKLLVRRCAPARGAVDDEQCGRSQQRRHAAEHRPCPPLEGAHRGRFGASEEKDCCLALALPERSTIVRVGSVSKSWHRASPIASASYQPPSPAIAHAHGGPTNRAPNSVRRPEHLAAGEPAPQGDRTLAVAAPPAGEPGIDVGRHAGALGTRRLGKLRDQLRRNGLVVQCS